MFYDFFLYEQGGGGGVIKTFPGTTPHFWKQERNFRITGKLEDGGEDVEVNLDTLKQDLSDAEGDIGDLQDELAKISTSELELGSNMGSYDLAANDTDGFILEFNLWDDADAETPVRQTWFNGYLPFSITPDGGNSGNGVLAVDETYTDSTGFFTDSEGDYYLKFENGVCKQVVSKASGTLETGDTYDMVISKDHNTSAETFIRNVPVGIKSITVTIVAAL
jgi:hypothetical protein